MKRTNHQSKNIPIDADASTVARGLASSYLHRALVNSRKLLKDGKSHESETLHNFRVAVRHLRGVLKTYKRAFPDVSKSDRKTLQRVANATNRARDLEVIISWVQSTKHSFAVKDHRAWNRFVSQLKSALSSELQQVKDERLKMFQSFSTALAKDLTRTRRSKSKYTGESFRAVTQDMLVHLLMQLRTQAECARICHDALLLHQMRINIKRARYLIEPLKDLRDAPEIIEHLKGLQDMLGSIQDIQVLIAFLIESLAFLPENILNHKAGEEERQVGLMLLEIASNEQKKRIAALNRAWFEKDLFVIVADLEAFTSRLASESEELKHQRNASHGNH